MSQTVVLQQNVTTQSITFQFDDCASNLNPISNADSKTQTLVNDTDSKKDMNNQSITIKFDDRASNVIPIPNLDSQTQAVVNEFLRKQGSPDEEVRTNAKNDLKSFLKEQEIGTLLVLVKFASDVNNSELLDIGCQEVADVIKDKSVEEVREIFNITNDFTPEEEQAIRDEHAWAFEN